MYIIFTQFEEAHDIIAGALAMYKRLDPHNETQQEEAAEFVRWGEEMDSVLKARVQAKQQTLDDAAAKVGEKHAVMAIYGSNLFINSNK